MAGLVTWGVMRHTTVTDSLTTTNQNKLTITGSIKSPATIGNRDTMIDLRQKPANRNITVQPKVIPQSPSIAKNEPHPTLTLSSVAKQCEPKKMDVIPSQTLTHNTATTVKINSQQKPVTEEKLKRSL